MIGNKELKQMLKEYGRKYTITMYINNYFNMTPKQLEYVMNYGGKQ